MAAKITVEKIGAVKEEMAAIEKVEVRKELKVVEDTVDEIFAVEEQTADKETMEDIFENVLKWRHHPLFPNKATARCP